MSAAIDLTGQRFDHLTAIRSVGLDANNNLLWECRCDCGTVKSVCSRPLRIGDTKSCGRRGCPYRVRGRKAVIHTYNGVG